MVQREENIGMPVRVAPQSTIKMFPVTYCDESWIKYRMTDVNAGSDVPDVCKGTIFLATSRNHFFLNISSVISDGKMAGAIAFTLILCLPSSKAITCNSQNWEQNKALNQTVYKRKLSLSNTFVMWFIPDFDEAYATLPCCWTLSKPKPVEMFIIDPPCPALRMCLPMYFDNIHAPSKFVLKTSSHSSWEISSEDFVPPNKHNTRGNTTACGYD